MADIDDLKAAFENAGAAINRRDIEGFSAFWHDEIVIFGLDVPFAIDGKAMATQVFQAVFENHEVVNVTPLNPQFRVIGNIGLAWGHGAYTFKPKDGPLHTTYARFLITCARVDGKWRAVSNHISRLPSGS